jgi:hypothetical protein
LKVGFGMEYTPCGAFQANAALFSIGVPTYNLYLGFRGVALGKGWQREQVQTVRWRLFQTAGKIVRHGRQTLLKISAAMLTLFAAIASVAGAALSRSFTPNGGRRWRSRAQDASQMPAVAVEAVVARKATAAGARPATQNGLKIHIHPIAPA